LQGFLCLLEEEKNEVPSFDISLLKERGNATHAATPRFTSDVCFRNKKLFVCLVCIWNEICEACSFSLNLLATLAKEVAWLWRVCS
jgi:hypothetical protein